MVDHDTQRDGWNSFDVDGVLPPPDDRDKWVARRVEIGGGRPDPLPTSDMFVADTVEKLRALLPLG
jgi:hypothetical protein